MTDADAAFRGRDPGANNRRRAQEDSGARRRRALLTIHARVDLLSMHLGAGLVHHAYVDAMVRHPWIAAELPCHLLTVLNRSPDSRKLQAPSVPQGNAVFHIEIISSQSEYLGTLFEKC